MKAEADSSSGEKAPKRRSERPTAKRISRLAICCGASALLTWLAIACPALIERPDSIRWTFPGLVAARWLMLLTALVALAALVRDIFHKEKMNKREQAIIIVSAVSSFLAQSVLPLDLPHYKQVHDRLVCIKKIKGLGAEITEYAAKHNGYLPIADKWCDLLIEHNKNLSRHSFCCPASKGACSYAFNKNLSGARLSDVPEQTVLLYESHEGWNLAGGAELLVMRHKGPTPGEYDVGNVLCVEGSIVRAGLDNLQWDIKAAEEPSTK